MPQIIPDYALFVERISKSFTQDICGNHDGSSIVSAIAALGGSLDLSLVAEGVETPEPREFLVTQQCDHMQGYRLSKPLQADQVARFITGTKFGRVA